MVLKPNEKVHVITRRRFESDLRRHFVGTVKEASETIARLEGHAYSFDSRKNEFVRLKGIRTKIINIGDSGFVINIIPPDVKLDYISYHINEDNRLVVTDMKDFTLDINEFRGKN